MPEVFMEKKNKKMLLIALALSLITAVLVYMYISGIKPEQVPEAEYVTVCAAAKTIPEHTQISASDIKEIEVAKELFNGSIITDKDQITGKWALQSIMEGEFIRKERLADEDSMNFSYGIPEGTRAVSMNITEQVNVANLLRPGDYVDVVASFDKDEDVYSEKTVIYPRITKMILQKVKVLALGQDTRLPAEKLKEQPFTITLAIKKEDIEKFVYASEYGIIRLALRPANDNSMTGGEGVTRSDVTGMKGVVVIYETGDDDVTDGTASEE
jgi:pilus assembly protein CpaB